MSKTFNFTSKIKDVQNRIVASTIREVSNLELLKSEEAIRDVIASYTSRFRAAEGMLTDITQYLAKSKSIVRLKDFNDLFESLYIDLQALYNDLEIVDGVLSLNLHRNKTYFLVIKKRIRDLWQRLRLTRLQVYDSLPGDESFYESFYTSVNSSHVGNIFVDKKNGYLSLSPKRKKVQNLAAQIKNITITNYPVESEDGGVVYTTSPLNSLEENYKSGPRDMMRNGLWKEELLCADVPDMIVNIGDSSKRINRAYRGAVSLVDIEYVYPLEINRFDIDIYGDRILDVDAILYKLKSTDDWSIARVIDEDTMTSADPTTSVNAHAAGRGFDVLSITNIVTFKAKYVRLVVNQRNYEFLDAERTNPVKLESSIDQDLGERRYELVKFHPSLEDQLTSPMDNTDTSLYSKIMNIVESTRTIADILTKINDLLSPGLRVVNSEFAKTLRFHVGAWSIEPVREEYTNLEGRYDSKPYTFGEGALISASMATNQSAPSSATCNWYISIKGKDIPVAANNNFWRKESLNFIDMSEYGTYSTWPGAFVLLDLPVDTTNADQIGIYENGVFEYQLGTQVAFLNSRLLYLHSIRDVARSQYTIRYPIALYSCVNQYVLNVRPGTFANKDLTLGICSCRREILEAFANSDVKYRPADSDAVSIAENYTISNGLCTAEEAKLWHGDTFPTCIWIDSEVYKQLIGVAGGAFSSLISTSNSKLSSTAADAQTYYDGGGFGPSDLSILGVTYMNIPPLSILRSL